MVQVDAEPLESSCHPEEGDNVPQTAEETYYYTMKQPRTSSFEHRHVSLKT
jgi:hypothetical protein